jgi:hypothetical protein
MAESGEPAEPAEPEHEAQALSECSDPSTARQALALGAVVVPGVLVHGAGSYVRGCRETAEKLLALEATGLGLGLAGGGTLMLTGAARSLAGVAVATAVTGGALLAMTWAADLYAVVAPDGGWGQAPVRVPLFETELGYAYVIDPRFDYKSFQFSRLSARFGRWHLVPSLWASPDDGNSRWRLLGGYRLFGASTHASSRDGSFVELQAAVTDHRFPADRFALSTAEWSARGRLDLGRLDRSLLGSFAELAVGSAFQATRFEVENAGTTGSSLLLYRFAFGAYVGDPRRGGGEAAVFYDHRHDGFAGGFLMSGLGSGPAGHLGLEGFGYFDGHWGLGAGASVGSAAVFQLSGRFRHWGTP